MELTVQRFRVCQREPGYFAADAAARDELARLRLIEADCDPHTLRYLTAIGVGAGWRCLEVGAGGGSVVHWLSRQVGAKGQVVAADLDPARRHRRVRSPGESTCSAEPVHVLPKRHWFGPCRIVAV
jgi:predicted O-methyltransferase YrrM